MNSIFLPALAGALLAGISVAGAAVSAIPASGWNYDMVLNGPGPYAPSVNGTMDGGLGQSENWTWVEAGTYTESGGTSVTIPGLVAGTQSSLTGNGTFTFQSFSGNNVIGLNAGSSAMLTLDTPASYSTLALYGASGFGNNREATVTFTFTDNSTVVFVVGNGTGISSDWFNGNPDRAFAVGSRASNRGEDGNMRLFIQTNTAISINESLFNLAPAEQAKLLQSVTIQSSGDATRMAIFALSGQAVPEPSTALLGLAGLVPLLRRRRR